MPSLGARCQAGAGHARIDHEFADREMEVAIVVFMQFCRSGACGSTRFVTMVRIRSSSFHGCGGRRSRVHVQSANVAGGIDAISHVPESVTVDSSHILLPRLHRQRRLPGTFENRWLTRKVAGSDRRSRRSRAGRVPSGTPGGRSARRRSAWSRCRRTDPARSRRARRILHRPHGQFDRLLGQMDHRLRIDLLDVPDVGGVVRPEELVRGALLASHRNTTRGCP